MSLDDFRHARIKKAEAIREAGESPYSITSNRTHRILDVIDNFDKFVADATPVTLVGRVMAQRSHGALTFLDIDDGSGTLQALFKDDVVGDKVYEFFTKSIDVGDFVEVAGKLFLTKRNERTLGVDKWKMLTKSIRPLPEKWHGLQDTEERLRHRYVDFIMNPDERKLFIKKSQFWQTIRTYLLSEGGLEVETPVLERIPGGADAEPFATHMKALDIDLFLRISLELPLKRLVVAGYEKVFEIGRIFRNEGIDREHLQDYTQMEMYWAYYDYEKLMSLVEKLYKNVIEKTLGTLSHKYQDNEIDWSGTWPKVDYYEIFQKHTGLDLSSVSEKDLKSYAVSEGIDTGKHLGRGRLIDVIFKKKVRLHLIQPCFLILPPVDIEPLAKRWPQDPNRVERFQVIAGGAELGKGFSELNDPLDQRARFEEQSKLREAGDVEAQRMDEDFVEALEYGMPPTAGFGTSERLFAFIMNRPIREIVFFPLIKPTQ